MSNHAFPKEERLRSRREFLRLNGGSKLHTAHFIMLWTEGPLEMTRVGFTVSKKIGNAVVRNGVKRKLRVFYRLNKPLFPKADLNIIAKKGADTLSSQQLGAELSGALGRLRNRYA